MPSNTADIDFLEELANRIREPNQKLLDEFTQAEKKRTLSNKLATKADKLIIADSKRNRKAAMKKPGGFTGRVARRAGGAVMGGIGGAIGGIPIVGAIFRAIGQEASNTLKDKKNYQKELARQRKIELKLMADYEAARKKKEQADLDAANPKPGRTRGTGGGAGITSATVLKLSNAAQSLEAAAISLAPAVKTFDEIAERIGDAVDTLANENARKVTDPQTLEYLHAIEYFSQSTAASVEKIEANMGEVSGGRSSVVSRKVMEHLYAIEYLTQESAVNLEKLAADHPAVVKDIDIIRTVQNKTHLSTLRIEKMLRKAAQDRLIQIDLQEDQLKYQKKQFESQEETKFIGLLNLLTSVMGGIGSTLGKVLGGLAGGKGVAKGVAKAGIWGAIGFGVYELSDAIAESLSKWLMGQSGFGKTMDNLSMMITRVLAFLGDDNAKAVVEQYDAAQKVAYAQDLYNKAGLQMTPEIQDYVWQNGTLPQMTKEQFENKGYAGGMLGGVGKRTDEEQAELVRNAWMDNARPMQPGEDLIPNSVALEEAKAKAALQQAQSNVVNAPSTTNNNSQTVLPPPLSADPAGAVSKSRNLGD